MGKVFDQVTMFKAKYPGTITWWRLKKHAKVIEEHINPDEEPIFSFAGQKTPETWDFFSTAVLTLTNKRILVAQDHILTGYTLNSVTPDMYNDLEVYAGVLWGRVTIDTVKERIVFTNIDKKALGEIETQNSQHMMEEKKKYGTLNNKKKD
jgi:hypothetical protein